MNNSLQIKMIHYNNQFRNLLVKHPVLNILLVSSKYWFILHVKQS